ncbi:MAG: 4-hydroxy-tetrahydrodipicolinate reductase [Candidatus Krumholzibacteria bacterium]
MSTVTAPTSVLVHGAGGRMGRAVLSLAPHVAEVRLKGILELRENRPLSGSVGAESLPVFGQVPQEQAENTAVIDFSRPEAMGRLVKAMSGSGISLVSGTTGLGGKERQLLKEYSEESAVFYDENMSYGILALKKLLRRAVSLLEDYDVEIVETHHAGKRDQPSGTALALSKVISPDVKPISGRGEREDRPVHIHSLRLGGVPGEHHVLFANREEVITLSHRAISRQVFARGAIRAAHFITSKKRGFYSMEDLLEDAS